MIEVFRIPISKDQLRTIPGDERNLLLLTSHAVNQISVLRKILMFSLNYGSDSEIENTHDDAAACGVSASLCRRSDVDPEIEHVR
jgi:hypothetical protein